MAELLELKKTLNLPKTDFPMKAALPQNEPKQLAAWQASHLYERILEAHKGQPLFVLHDGPPYPTGTIHLGTGLNKILKDMIVKSKNMAGHYAPYVPGWDCHGLPIETQVEKELGGKGKVSPTEFLPYMSPEQLRGLPVDMRSDIYAAGAVLYEMATGRRPFPQTQTAELMTAILVQTLPPARSVNPVVSPKMESVIAKSLEKDPTQRFQSARDLRAALQGVAALSSTVSFQPDPQLMASSESACLSPPLRNRLHHGKRLWAARHLRA